MICCMTPDVAPGLDDDAAAADGLGLVDLQYCRSGVPDREEEFRILVTAGSLVAPVHAVLLPVAASFNGADLCLAP